MGLRPGLPIPDDWDGISWCQFAICWPDSLQWRAILAGFITTPMLGRTWDGDTGTITDVQSTGREIFDKNLDWRYSIVSVCGDAYQSFIDALNAIATALATPNCCASPGTPGGAGTGGAGPNDEEIHPPITPNEPPTGWDSWAEFLADKCAYLSWWVDQIEADITTMSQVQLIGATALSLLPILATLFLVPIPGARLFAMASLLIAVAAYGVSTLSNMASAFATAKDEILCRLYISNTPETGLENAIAAFNDAMAVETTDPVQRAYASQLITYFLNNDGYNRAFTLQSRQYPAGDCDECGYQMAEISAVGSTGIYVDSVRYTGNQSVLPIDGQAHTLSVDEAHTNGYYYIQWDCPAGFDYVIEIAGANATGMAGGSLTDKNNVEQWSYTEGISALNDTWLTHRLGSAASSTPWGMTITLMPL